MPLLFAARDREMIEHYLTVTLRGGCKCPICEGRDGDYSLSLCLYQSEREEMALDWLIGDLLNYQALMGYHDFGFSTSPASLPLYWFEYHRLYSGVKAVLRSEKREKEELENEQRELMRQARSQRG